VSKSALWVVIGIAAFVVVALAVLTPTVIAGDDDGYARSVRVAAPAPATPAPFPFRRGVRPNLWRCLEQHGLANPRPDRLPGRDELRRAFRDCAPFRR
jgi:hypothetical protein